MYHRMVLKRILFPMSSTTVLAAMTLTSEQSKDESEKKELVRPRDLSIYSKPPQQSSVQEEPKPESALLSVVRQVREGLWTVMDQFSHVSEKVNHVVETGKAHASSSIQILREEDNYPQRYGAIAVGGLLGYLVAIRRGKFRRLVYTATGAAAVAAICYPEEAKEYTSEGFHLTKHYIVIAYHFINGVLRDYVGVQLPSLPGPLAIGSSSAAEKDPSTVPTSAALMPHHTAAPSLISSGPITLPPIDWPKSVSDNQKKQG